MFEILIGNSTTGKPGPSMWTSAWAQGRMAERRIAEAKLDRMVWADDMGMRQRLPANGRMWIEGLKNRFIKKWAKCADSRFCWGFSDTWHAHLNAVEIPGSYVAAFCICEVCHGLAGADALSDRSRRPGFQFPQSEIRNPPVAHRIVILLTSAL